MRRFSSGKNAIEAARKSLILERVAQMALGSLQLNPDIIPIPLHIQEKHFNRKHGPYAYYGQKNK